jgi:hypothetical protein
MKKSKPFVYVTVIGTFVLVITAWMAILGPERLFLIRRYWSRVQPVVFFGRVVDQGGRPLVGAKVSIVIDAFNMSSLAGSTDYLKSTHVDRVTDVDGNFAVQGLSGTYLRIERIEAPGFMMFPDPRWNRFDLLGYRYSRDRAVPYHIPDPNKPAIFPLRKEGEPRTIWPTRGGRDEPNP